jgi:hypothetical protein
MGTSVSPWRKAADNGHTDACRQPAFHIYQDRPYAREIGRVEEAAGIAASVGIFTEGHDVALDVLDGMVYWVAKTGELNFGSWLSICRGWGGAG